MARNRKLSANLTDPDLIDKIFPPVIRDPSSKINLLPTVIIWLRKFRKAMVKAFREEQTVSGVSFKDNAVWWKIKKDNTQIGEWTGSLIKALRDGKMISHRGILTQIAQYVPKFTIINKETGEPVDKYFDKFDNTFAAGEILHVPDDLVNQLIDNLADKIVDRIIEA